MGADQEIIGFQFLRKGVELVRESSREIVDLPAPEGPMTETRGLTNIGYTYNARQAVAGRTHLLASLRTPLYQTHQSKSAFL